MRLSCVAALLAVFLPAAHGQETRSTINGRVYDQQSAAIRGAKVVVTHLDTNAAVALTTNETGYFEAPLLIPGNYRISAEAPGFKHAIREGVALQVDQQLTIDMKMDVGAVTESVVVTAEAPVLDISSVESGALIDNQQLMDLPVVGNNPTLLAKLMPGMQNTDGVNNYLGLHSIAGGSGYNNAAGVGGNEWSIDGVPNNGGSRQAAYLPYSDAISEFRIDTTGFDVSQGRGTGASITAMTKAGTNQYHGTLTEQHWQQRFNGTPYFTRQLYFKNIKDAEAAGNTALADQLRHTERQSSGHSNNWGATIGGPISVPKIYNGKNKLFTFFSYNGFRDNKTEEPNAFNKTVPTMANREGDFSDLLKVDAVKYQIYDPLTVKRDTSRSGTYWMRDPMPGNIVPKWRILMPKMYKFYSDLYPIPNNNPSDPKQEPKNNYLAVATPWLWNYRAYQNRIDYNVNQSHRFFGRWSWNNFDEDRGDWTYSTIRGLNSGGLNRKNMGATVDWTWTINGTTLLDVSAAGNEFTSGNRQPVPTSYKPSDIGLPSYLDDAASDRHILPRITINGYTQPSPDGYPSFTRFRIYSLVGNLSHFRGRHTIKGGADTRQHFRTGGGGGNTSGYFRFDERYTRKYGDTNLITPGSLGLSWAALMMGMNYDSQISIGDTTYATYSGYYGGYLQDSFRVSRKLTLNLGMRLEYEGGPTERYNRMIGYFDPSLKLAITDISTAALAAKPPAAFNLGGTMITIDPSKVNIIGGVTFPGVNGVPRNAWQGQVMFMPRFAFAYQITPRTVLRGGAGTFFDTLNVTNFSPNQTGFDRTTTWATEKNAGSTWQAGDPANGISPLMDPFPAIRAGGARFDMSANGALGPDTLSGNSYTFSDYPVKRAHQHRWRVGVQRQVGRDNVISAIYTGSYSRDVIVKNNLNALPAQYWWNGIVRNSSWSSALDGGVTNPFNLNTNYPSLAQTNPLLYADMAGKTFFTDSNIARQKLLRPYPTVNTGLNNDRASLGQVRTNGVEITFNRRFSHGFNTMVSYTGTNARTADWFPNEFDVLPAWRESNYSRPHRLTATGMYQFPFGRRKPFFKSGLMSRILGGMQLSGTFEYAPGQLAGDWGNRYYYGDINDIKKDNPTLDEWFNAKGTGCADTPGANTGWERCSQRGPAGYQTRVFPIRVPGVRRDRTLQTNANVQKEFPLRHERIKFVLRFDMLNVFNRYQFDNPNIDPMSTNFGMVTQQTAAQNRFLQFQARLQF